MTETRRFPVPAPLAHHPHIDAQAYARHYEQSVEDPESFWADQAARLLTWDHLWHRVKDTSFAPDDVHIRWFEGGRLNVAANCLDRHLEERGYQTAILWEPDEPGDACQQITYRELHARVCRAANMLKSLGVKAGDTVTLYMPMIPEAAIAMLACARIGAVHSVVFGGFSPEALRGRIRDGGSRVVITADEGVRGGKRIPLKASVDAALEGLTPSPRERGEGFQVLVVRRTGGSIAWDDSRDHWWHALEADASDDCPAEPFDAEHPLFILYTSGSTGSPKGLLHTSAGYLLYATATFQYVFDYQPGDVYWCTADVGWITGHSYLLYGPLAAGATTLMFEGVPTYPTPARCWQIIDQHKVTQFYTAPTALRMLIHEGENWLEGSSRASLRVLGSVGEPINPEVWMWYHEKVGGGRCRVVDTWWQTETGGHLITPLPYATELKPGSATKPFFGIKPVLLDSTIAQPLFGEAEGALCIADSWPGQARSIWGDHTRFVDTYFKPYPGYYFSGDAAARDADGDYWLKGRMDDVINVSGHRIGTAEVESALVAHAAVTEAAVVGYPHEIKGEDIHAYVTLRPSVDVSTPEKEEALKQELRQWVRKEIGALAVPGRIQLAPGLPKTRSGKIMRRILRKIAAGDVKGPDDMAVLGDVSTLLDPAVVEALVTGWRTLQKP